MVNQLFSIGFLEGCQGVPWFSSGVFHKFSMHVHWCSVFFPGFSMDLLWISIGFHGFVMIFPIDLPWKPMENPRKPMEIHSKSLSQAICERGLGGAADYGHAGDRRAARLLQRGGQDGGLPSQKPRGSYGKPMRKIGFLGNLWETHGFWGFYRIVHGKSMGKEGQMDEHGDLSEKKTCWQRKFGKNVEFDREKKCSTYKTWDIMEMMGGDLSIKDGDLSIKWWLNYQTWWDFMGNHRDIYLSGWSGMT